MTALAAPLFAAVSLTRQRKARIALGALIALLCVVVIASAGIGAVELSPKQVVAALLKGIGVNALTEVTRQQQLVVWAIRLPRIVFSGMVGGALATIGASLQGVFRNPLADPSLIGISSGASLAAAAVMVLGGGAALSAEHSFATALLPAAAFAGALVATLFMLRLSREGSRTVVPTMLLCGIAINALAMAGTGAFTFAASDRELRSLAFWTLGSVGGSTWAVVAVSAPLLLASIFILPRFARTLNLMLLGEAEARHLGVNVDRVKRIVVVLSALGVGAAVAFSGVIGFVGLVVPHLLRLVLGPDNRLVLRLSPLLGASLLIGADLIGRTIVSPAELPIGIVTAAIGAPFFLWLVVRQRSAGGLL